MAVATSTEYGPDPIGPCVVTVDVDGTSWLGEVVV